LKAAEQVIRGRRPDAALLHQAGEAAGEEAQPIADQHGSAAYKRALLRVHTARALQAALGSQAGAVS
jgi:carbon-monoxide dehydrogenase medium subunit